MYIIKLYTSSGKFIGEIEEKDVDEVLEIVKDHITNNDTIAIVSDKEYIEGIKII